MRVQGGEPTTVTKGYRVEVVVGGRSVCALPRVASLPMFRIEVRGFVHKIYLLD